MKYYFMNMRKFGIWLNYIFMIVRGWWKFGFSLVPHGKMKNFMCHIECVPHVNHKGKCLVARRENFPHNIIWKIWKALKSSARSSKIFIWESAETEFAERRRNMWRVIIITGGRKLSSPFSASVRWLCMKRKLIFAESLEHLMEAAFNEIICCLRS